MPKENKICGNCGDGHTGCAVEPGKKYCAEWQPKGGPMSEEKITLKEATEKLVEAAIRYRCRGRGKDSVEAERCYHKFAAAIKLVEAVLKREGEYKVFEGEVMASSCGSIESDAYAAVGNVDLIDELEKFKGQHVRITIEKLGGQK